MGERAPGAVAPTLAVFLAAGDRAEDFESALAGTRSTARGRCKRDLSAADLTDIDAEAGTLLLELGYDGTRPDDVTWRSR